MEKSNDGAAWKNQTVSVVVRFHDWSKMSLLDHALFSLANQSYPHVQVIVVVQNGHPRMVKDIVAMLIKQPFDDLRNKRVPEIDYKVYDNVADDKTTRIQVSKHQVISLRLPPGIDGRSFLINEGIKMAQGRFLAFLDYDDRLYQHAYQLLIERIHASGAAIAVGGCFIAEHRVISERGTHYVERKTQFLSQRKVKADLFSENFIPIHTYVIDRAAVVPSLLHFDTNLNANEDYLFLLRIAAEYEFDFELQGIAVGEYCQRNDGTNTIQVGAYRPEKEVNLIYSREYVERIKKTLKVKIMASEIAMLIRQRDAMLNESKTGCLMLDNNSDTETTSMRIARRFDKFLLNHPLIKRITTKMKSLVKISFNRL